MSILDKFRKHDSPTQDALPSANPTGEELAAMQAAAQASPDVVRQRQLEAERADYLRQAADAGRLMVHNSEVSGEVPIVTPGMERPADTADEEPVLVPDRGDQPPEPTTQPQPPAPLV